MPFYPTILGTIEMVVFQSDARISESATVSFTDFAAGHLLDFCAVFLFFTSAACGPDRVKTYW